MSGTSGDGIDAALVCFENNRPKLIDSHFTPFEETLKNAFTALFTPANNEIDRMGEADNHLGQAYLKSVENLLSKTGRTASSIKAIGLHGQTIRHRPNADSPFTLQIGNPYYLTHRLGIPVVNDFRRADMVQGGQGAPLAPLFHQALFASTEENRVIVNTGGIANISYLDKAGNVFGFDTGPANCLMDSWIIRNRQESFDRNGRWASTGEVIHHLLDKWLADPYFEQKPPKSTGREYFTLQRFGAENQLDNFPAKDIQRTLCELTAVSISRAIHTYCPEAEQVFVCGGGSQNSLLMARIEQTSGLPTESTAAIGVAPDWVEAVGFAWLAKACMSKTPINTSPITGSTTACILGAIHPACV